MIETPLFALDASVAAKWHLKDESHVLAAEAVLQDTRAQRIQLVAPEHIRYEAASAILNATRNRQRSVQLTVEDGLISVGLIRFWGIEYVSDPHLLEGGYTLAQRLGCSLYDGVYLALALARNCPLIYADDRLRRALRGRFPLALWIEDYQPLG